MYFGLVFTLLYYVLVLSLIVVIAGILLGIKFLNDNDFPHKRRKSKAQRSLMEKQ